MRRRLAAARDHRAPRTPLPAVPSAAGADSAPRAAPARQLWPDCLKAVAAAWVVMIHVAAVPATHLGQLSTRAWWWANVYNAASRAAVPIFIMVSGALLLNRERWRIGEFLRGRAAKLLPPMIFWTLFYDGWKYLARGTTSGPHDWLVQILDGLDRPAYPHLWFLWLIGGLYLAAPLLQSFAVAGSRQSHRYVAALWCAATALVPLVTRWTGLQIGLYLAPVAGFVGYFIVGASISRFVPERLPRPVVLPLVGVFLAGAAATALTTAALSLGETALDETFMDPLSPSVIPMALAAFLLARHWAAALAARPVLCRVVQCIGLNSFGIYLLHPLVIDLADRLGLGLDPLPADPAWYVPLLAALVFAVSAVAAVAVRRFAAGRWVVP